MNVRMCPTSTDYELHPSMNRVFIWFYSVPFDVGVSLDKGELKTLIGISEKALMDLKKRSAEVVRK